jgi:hypothetical protein
VDAGRFDAAGERSRFAGAPRGACAQALVAVSGPLATLAAASAAFAVAAVLGCARAPVLAVELSSWLGIVTSRWPSST